MSSPRNTAPSCIRSSVESRKPPSTEPFPLSRAISPSMRSEKTKRVMKTVPQKSSPIVEDQRPGADAQCADHRHSVGGQADAQQAPGDRREQRGEEGAGVPVQHPCPPSAPEAACRRAKSRSASGQASHSSRWVSPSVWDMFLVWAMIGRKLPSPPQRGTTCWCRWADIPAPPTLPWLIPRLNSGGRHPAQRGHRDLCQPGELSGLLRGEVGQVRDVAVGTDQQMSRIVGVEVQDDEAAAPPMDDQRGLILVSGAFAEGAVLSAGHLILATLEVGGPVRVPQTLEGIRDPGRGELPGRVRRRRLILHGRLRPPWSGWRSGSAPRPRPPGSGCPGCRRGSGRRRHRPRRPPRRRSARTGSSPWRPYGSSWGTGRSPRRARRARRAHAASPRPRPGSR